MRIIRRILITTFFSFFCLYSSDFGLQDFRINCLESGYKQQLEAFLPDVFYLDDVSYELDFLYDHSQLTYLTGLVANTEISTEQLLSACFYLKQHDRFKSIELYIQRSDVGYSCTFVLSGRFILSSITVTGYMKGKDVYKNLYLLDAGEVFDQQKHELSMQDIQKVLQDRGYCDATISDTVKYDDKRKAVYVSLSLLKGVKYFIDTVSCKVEPIGSVSPADSKRMEQKLSELLHSKLKFKVYSQEVVKKIEHKVKNLLERYGFMNFDLTLKEQYDREKKRVSLEYQIVLEQKKDFIFWGNRFFTRQELLNHLLMYGKSSWLFPSSIIIDELVQLYKSKGFWNVDVSIKDDKNRLFCVIKENERASISHVRLKDNDHFSSAVLSRHVGKSLLRTKYFDKERVKKEIESLIRFYKQHGFWDAKIVKEEYKKTKKNNVYVMELTLDEGKQKKVGSYTVQGYQELEKQGPFARIKKEKGQGFDPMILLEQKQWLARYFKNLGYNKVSVHYNIHESDNNVLDIVWHVQLKGEAVKFGKVIITGSSKVPPSCVMREVTIEQDQPWNKSRLEETLKRVRELEIFESIQLYPSREVDGDLQKPVFMKLVDADRYELRTRMGLQQVGKNLRLRRGFTWKIGGSFFIRNPFLLGDRIEFLGDFTRFYRDFSASYSFPWLFARSVRSQYKVYDKLYYQPVYIGSQCSLYQAGQRGFLCNITKAFSKVTVSGTAGVEFMDISEADQPRLYSIIDYDQSLLGKKTGYLFLEPTLMWQRVDSVINPKQGHLSFVSCKGMIDLDTNTSLFKLLVEHSFYVPLSDPLVLAIRMRGGHVFNRSFKQLIPIERFYLGGPGSLRGYERDYCPPFGELTMPIKDEHAGLPKEACDFWNYAPQGARTMLNLNCELRFPIYKSFGGVVFNDIGVLFKDSVQHVLRDKSDNLLGGTGFGFRYDTPIGPLRFDVGFKWNRLFRNFESRWAYYITLGHAF